VIAVIKTAIVIATTEIEIVTETATVIVIVGIETAIVAGVPAHVLRVARTVAMIPLCLMMHVVTVLNVAHSLPSGMKSKPPLLLLQVVRLLLRLLLNQVVHPKHQQATLTPTQLHPNKLVAFFLTSW
jgi:hypothetical protein